MHERDTVYALLGVMNSMNVCRIGTAPLNDKSLHFNLYV